MIKKMLSLSTIFALSAGSACAQDSDGGFSSVDTDGSGSISLAEMQYAKPDATAEDFTLYDTDGDGDLSLDEYAGWIAAINQSSSVDR